MALLTVQTISLGLSGSTYSGTNPTFVAAVGPDTFLNRDGRTYLEVINAGGSPITVTLNSLSNCGQGHDHNVVVTVPNGERRKIGQLDPGRFSDSSGLVTVTYSGITSVTVGAFSLRENG